MRKDLQHTFKNWVFIALILVLFVPMIRQILSNDKSTLAGVFETTEYKPLTVNSWLSGDYQENTSEYVNTHFGYRDFFVRLHNQRLYWMFKETTAFNIVIGKDDYLFGKSYIDAYYGTDYLGVDSIQQIVSKLKSVQHRLAQKGTKLVIVLAPGKGSFYPEYIPEKYQKRLKRRETNLATFVHEFDQNQINYINFHQWFLSMKNTSPYPLFPKGGIHWSAYGEYLVADSLTKFINQHDIAGEVRLNSIETKTQYNNEEYDIANTLNLLFQIEPTSLAVPHYTFVQNSKPKRPILVIADSFYWGLFNRGMSQQLFGEGQFWYYNKDIYPDSYQQPKTVNQNDYWEEMEKNQIVFLICTDGNLTKFPFGLTDLK